MSCICMHKLASNAAANVYSIPPLSTLTQTEQQENTFLAPSIAASLQIPQHACLTCRTAGSNYNMELGNQLNCDVYHNVDGVALKRNVCLQACNNHYAPMMNPIGYTPSQNWVMPGGVVSAVRYLAKC